MAPKGNNVEIIDNSEEVLKAFDNAIERGLEAIGLVAEGYAKQSCPVDTGRLRNSISHAVDPIGNAAYIGTNVEYAPYVEFGTSKMAPRPFLRPAALEHSEEYKALMKESMENA